MGSKGKSILFLNIVLFAISIFIVACEGENIDFEATIDAQSTKIANIKEIASPEVLNTTEQSENFLNLAGSLMILRCF